MITTNRCKMAFVLSTMFVLAACGQQTAQKPVTVEVTPAPLSIVTPDRLPQGFLGIAYSLTFEAQGGLAPYTWVVISGTLTPGWTLSKEGILSGIATQTGSFNFVIEVTDSAGITARLEVRFRQRNGA